MLLRNTVLSLRLSRTDVPLLGPGLRYVDFVIMGTVSNRRRRGRLSWLPSAFYFTLNTHYRIVSYRIVSYESMKEPPGDILPAVYPSRENL